MRLEDMKPQVKDMEEVDLRMFVREYRTARNRDFEAVVLKATKRKTKSKARSESVPLTDEEMALMKALGLSKTQLKKLRQAN